MSNMLDQPFVSELERWGYLHFRERCGRLQCLCPYIFTWAILDGVDATGYSRRWCYESLAEAQGAFDDWDGEGEPEGFIRRTHIEPMDRHWKAAQ